MEEKLRFVFAYERDEQTMCQLCASFGISRETGYQWLRRYRAGQVAGLVELNRAPHRHPNQTEAAIEQAVLELRQAHMRWGAGGPVKSSRLCPVHRVLCDERAVMDASSESPITHLETENFRSYLEFSR